MIKMNAACWYCLGLISGDLPQSARFDVLIRLRYMIGAPAKCCTISRVRRHVDTERAPDHRWLDASCSAFAGAARDRSFDPPVVYSGLDRVGYSY
jgi:hypothetical protein